MIEPIALPVQRSPRQTLHHVWAPKLRRIVMLTGQDQLHLWAMLEAHPGVIKYCERPASPDAAQASTADFWAIRDGTATWLRLVEAPVDDAAALARATSDEGVELISPDELKRHRVWIRNWLSLLPYLSTTGTLSLESLKAQVVEAAGREDATFDEMERQLSPTDPVLIRTAVIAALHAGLLISEDLLHKPWDRSTRVCQPWRRDRDAPQ